MASASGSNVNRSGYNRPANPNAAVYQSNYPDENPYSSIDPTDQLSGWQNFWDRLGVTDYAGKAIYKHNMQVADYDSQLAARDYNSEVAQVERANRAGLNSDLLGVNRNEYAPSPAGEGASMDEDSLSNFGGIFPMIGNAVINAFALWKGFAEVQNSNIVADSAMMNEDFSSQKKLLAGYAASVFDSLKEDNSKYSVDDVVKSLQSGIMPDDMFNYSDMEMHLRDMTAKYRTKRQREYARRQLDNYLVSEDFISDVLDVMTRHRRSQSDIISAQGSLSSQFDKGLVDGVRTIWNLNYDLQQVKNKYEHDYYNRLKGASMADATLGAANSSNAINWQNYNFQKEVNHHLKSAVDKLLNGDSVYEHILAAEILKGSLTTRGVVSGATDIVKLAMPGR